MTPLSAHRGTGFDAQPRRAFKKGFDMDKLIRDYVVGQVRHNGKHYYCTGEHWLFGKLDRALTIAQAREHHRDEFGSGGGGMVKPSWGFRNPELAEFCQRWDLPLFQPPLRGIPRKRYGRTCHPSYVYRLLKPRHDDCGHNDHNEDHN